jgi:hypothetical protein
MLFCGAFDDLHRHGISGKVESVVDAVDGFSAGT